jgi:hypothetical protein
MSIQFNRVAIAKKNLEEREARMQEIYRNNPLANKVLAKDRLHQYENIMARFAKTNNDEEQLALKMLKPIMADLEKKVYPSKVVQLWRWLFKPARFKKIEQNWQLQKSMDSARLKQDMDKMKMFSAAKRVEKYVELDQPAFKIPATMHLTAEKRLEFDMPIAKDAAGRYQLQHVEAALRNEQNPAENRSFIFSPEMAAKLDVVKMQRLLHGNAVKLDNWVQLNFDQNGKGQLKEKQYTHEFNTVKALKELLPPGLQMKADMNLTARELEKGTMPDVRIKANNVEQTYYLKADPFNDQIIVYDDTGKKIDPKSLLPPAVQKVVEPQQQQQKQQQLTNSVAVQTVAPVKAPLAPRKDISQQSGITM